MVLHACNPSTREAKAGESRVQVQTKLRRETLLKKQNTNKRAGVVETMPTMHRTWVQIPGAELKNNENSTPSLITRTELKVRDTEQENNSGWRHTRSSQLLRRLWLVNHGFRSSKPA
jgi:hypothetical protein